MIDITDEVKIEDTVPARPGVWAPAKILYHGKAIGHMECQGPVSDSAKYFFVFKPNRQGRFEQRYYALEPHELEP